MTTSNYLLEAVTADTVGDTISGTGGAKVIQISGLASTGGGAVTIEGRLEPTFEWTVLTYGGNPATFTADKILMLNFWAASMQLRATLAGASGTFSVNVALFG